MKSLLRNRAMIGKFRQYSSSAIDPWFLKSSYSWFLPIQTRWKDNDQYHHLNNAVYHTLFEHVLTQHQIKYLNYDMYDPETPLGYTLMGNCTFLGSARYPEIYLTGLGVQKLGNSSLHYRMALFAPKLEGEEFLSNLVNGHKYNDPLLDKFEDKGLVLGEQVAVFVDPRTRKPVPMAEEWKQEFSKLMMRTS